MRLNSDKKILPLCYKHVIAMSSHKIRGEISLACVFTRLFKAPKGNLVSEWILFEVRPFLVALPYFADFYWKPS